MKYYYEKSDLFGSTWVECTHDEYRAAYSRKLNVRQVHDNHVPYDDGTDEEEYVSDTPLKDALLDELRDSTPAVVSILADVLIEEEDLQEILSATPEEVQYHIDEELINPDYDELEFDGGEEQQDDGVFSAPIASSSSNTNRWFPNAAITMSPHLKSDIDGIKRVAAAIYTLMEGGMQYDSDELDGTKFVKRLETSRSVSTNVNRKTRANPSLLFMPDFSPSCSSYAQLYFTLLEGVTSIRDDFNVISAPHFNGLPKWFVINGKKTLNMKMWERDSIHVDEDGDFMGTFSYKDDAQEFYFKQIVEMINTHNITTVVIAGDMDGTWMFKKLTMHPSIERVIWVDGSSWGDESNITDNTGRVTYSLFTKNSERQVAKSKMSYWSNVKTVKDFVRAFERSNSW